MSTRKKLAEPERVWIIRLTGEPPDSGRPIHQAYLVSGDPEFRIRFDGGWILTAKAGPKADRVEIEAPFSGDGDAVFQQAPGGRISKVRFVDGPWELDMFLRDHLDLFLLELENPPAELPPFPDYVDVIAEVTSDPRFKNVNLASLSRAEVEMLLKEFYGSAD